MLQERALSDEEDAPEDQEEAEQEGMSKDNDQHEYGLK